MPRVRTRAVSVQSENDTEIVSIAPAAEGWRAVVHSMDDEEGSKFHVYPILCWALVRRPYDEDGEKGIDTEVVPMIAEIRANYPSGTFIASHFKLFAGVAAPNVDPAEIARSDRQIEFEERVSVMPSAGDA